MEDLFYHSKQERMLSKPRALLPDWCSQMMFCTGMMNRVVRFGFEGNSRFLHLNEHFVTAHHNTLLEQQIFDMISYTNVPPTAN